MSATPDSPSTRRVLITGASGFIGYPCLAALRERDFEVHAVSSRAQAAADGVTWHTADLLAADSARALVQTARPTHLLHLAWYVEPGVYLASPRNHEWVRASLELVREFAAAGGRRVVGCGTGYEYDNRAGWCVEGVTPTVPSTVYGSCKLELGKRLLEFGEASGVSAAWGRAFFVYGPREARGRLVSSVILSLLRGEPAKCSHGRQVRDYLHTQDVANAFVALLDSEVTGVVNVSSGAETTIAELVTTIGRIFGKPELIELGAIPARADDAALIVGRNERLVNGTGWRQRFTVETGLRDTIDWWRTQEPA